MDVAQRPWRQAIGADADNLRLTADVCGIQRQLHKAPEIGGSRIGMERGDGENSHRLKAANQFCRAPDPHRISDNLLS